MELKTMAAQSGKVLVLALLLSWNLLSQNTNFPKETLNDARIAYRNYNPDLAEQILNAIWQDLSASREDRINAGKHLSQIHSQFLNDPDRAKEIIEQTIKLDPKDSNSYLRFSQIASAFDWHELALENAESAIAFANTKDQKVASYGSYGKILLRKIIVQIDEGPLVNNFADYNLDRNQIINTVKQLERVLQEDPNQLQLLKTKFALEVLAGEGKRALMSWERYFNYSDESNTLLKNTYSELKKSLSTWNDGKLSIEKKKVLAKALAKAKDFDLSMVIIKTIPRDQILADIRLTEIENYYLFLGKIKALTDALYRDTAQKKPNPRDYRNNLIAYVKQLWNTFEWTTGEPPEFSLNNVESEIDKRFGAAIRIGNSNGWFSITWGHKVIEYSTSIEQYGLKANLVFRSLDYMMSNGFIGWYFSSLGTIGGWQSDNLVYQVRPRYLSGPNIAWTNVSNSEAVLKQEEKIKEDMKNDVLMAAEEEISIFLGMLAQIKFKSQFNLLKDIKKTGYTGDELQQEFKAAFQKLTFENEILSHEGRHLIDRIVEKEQGVKYGQEELEYRAKLSEIAFSKYPFMALGSIFHGGIDNSPHGMANERLAKELYNWMDKNWQEVKGIDANLPKNMQLSKLTDEQLVSIIRFLDPLND